MLNAKHISKYFLINIQSFFQFFLDIIYKSFRFRKIILKNTLNLNQIIKSIFY